VRARPIAVRRVGRLSAAALLWVTVAACAPLSDEPEAVTPVPRGGVHVYSPTVALIDVWLDAPSGVPLGGAADLRLYVVNSSGRRDALTGVTSSLVRGDELRLDGPSVAQIPLPRGEAVNLEWGNGSGVRLTGFRRPLRPASWMHISLHFKRSETITMQVVAGPLGTPDTTSAPRSPQRRGQDGPEPEREQRSLPPVAQLLFNEYSHSWLIPAASARESARKRPHGSSAVLARPR
jgi:hypothetical protein